MASTHTVRFHDPANYRVRTFHLVANHADSSSLAVMCAHYSTSCAVNVDKHYLPAQTASQGAVTSPLRNPSNGWYTSKKNNYCRKPVIFSHWHIIYFRT